MGPPPWTSQMDNVYNIRPTQNVPTVTFGASGTSMGTVPKAADRFRARAPVVPPRPEHRQGDHTRPQGGERFCYKDQCQVQVTDNYGLGNQLPVSNTFRTGRLMQATKRFTQPTSTNHPRSTDNYIFPGTDGSMPRMPGSGPRLKQQNLTKRLPTSSSPKSNKMSSTATLATLLQISTPLEPLPKLRQWMLLSHITKTLSLIQTLLSLSLLTGGTASQNSHKTKKTILTPLSP
jgi:hypothetical protein